MNLSRLTHFLNPNIELWVDLNEIVYIERHHKIKTSLLTTKDDEPEFTSMVLKNNRIVTCLETPEEIFKLHAETNPVVDIQKLFENFSGEHDAESE